MTFKEQREQDYQDHLRFLKDEFPDAGSITRNQARKILHMGNETVSKDTKLMSLFTEQGRVSYITLPALARYMVDMQGKKRTTQGAGTPKGGIRKHSTRV